MAVTVKFKLGQMVTTAGVNALMDKKISFYSFVRESIKRHSEGDWGDLCEADKKANDEALEKGGRLFSAYEKEGQPKIWIITEHDRSVTTVLFPEEY